MTDLERFFDEQGKMLRWRAERENATARLELAEIRARMAYLLSQHEPVASLGMGRERLRLALQYLLHGDLSRHERDFEELRVAEARKGA